MALNFTAEKPGGRCESPTLPALLHTPSAVRSAARLQWQVRVPAVRRRGWTRRRCRSTRQSSIAGNPTRPTEELTLVEAPRAPAVNSTLIRAVQSGGELAGPRVVEAAVSFAAAAVRAEERAPVARSETRHRPRARPEDKLRRCTIAPYPACAK